MRIWHPAPRGLINEAAAERWTRKKPAPALVVYMWIWSQRDDGTPPTRRQVARLFGWTEHHARTMIRKVGEDQNEWRRLCSPKQAPKAAQQSPSQRSDSSNLQGRTAQPSPRFNPESPDRARAITQHNTQHTDRERLSLEEMRTWQALK